MMKRISLIAAIAITAIAAVQAVPAKQHRGLHKSMQFNEMVSAKIGHASTMNGTETAKMRKAAKKGPMHRAPKLDLAGPTEEQEMTIITEAPEGKTGFYAKHGYTLVSYDDYVMEFDLDGYCAEIVITDDNKIYMAPPFAIGTGEYGISYIVGDIKDNVATFNFPQGIYRGWFYNAAGSLFEDTDYALLMEIGEYEYNGQTYETLMPSDKQTLSFNIDENGTLTAIDSNEEVYVASAWWDEYYGWDWSGSYADVYESFSPMTDETITIPEGIAAEEWNVIVGTSAYPAKVAISGSDIYVSGIYSNLPEGTMAGKIVDGKATFKSGQFLGVYRDIMVPIYAMSVKMDMVYDEDYDEEYEDLVADGKDITFVYDSEKGTLTSESIIGFSAKSDKMMQAAAELDKPLIVKPSEKEITSISKPVINAYECPDGVYGAYLAFSISNIANETDIIPADKLFFSIYLNDEVFEFEPEDYNCFTEPTSLVPYGQVDDTETYSIEYNSQYNIQELLIYVEGFTTIGVQAIYKDGDKEVRSEITTIPGDKDYDGEGDEDAIVSVEAESGSVSYFDLQGRRISAPAPGQIAIRKSGNTAKVVKF